MGGETSLYDFRSREKSKLDPLALGKYRHSVLNGFLKVDAVMALNFRGLHEVRV